MSGELFPAVMVLAVENGLELGVLGQLGIGPDQVVPFRRRLVLRRDVDRHDLVGEVSLVPCPRREHVAPMGECVLGVSRDPVLFGHPLSRLAHGLACRVFRQVRGIGNKIPEAHGREGLEPFAHAPGGVGLVQRLLQRRRDGDRDVAGTFRPTGQSAVDRPVADRLDDVDGGLVARRARPRDAVRLDSAGEADAQDDLARDVRLAERRDDLPVDDLFDFRGVDFDPIQELAADGLAQVERRQVLEIGPPANEGGPQSGHDRDGRTRRRSGALGRCHDLSFRLSA